MLIRRPECRNGRIVLLAVFLVMVALGPVHAGMAFLPAQYLTMRLAIDGGLVAASEIIDCNENGIDDAQDIADMTSADCNTNGIPDECDLDTDGDGVPDDCDTCDNNFPETCTFASPILAPPPHDILKNRYISIDPRGAGGINVGLTFDIRVELASSLVNGVTGVGPWWASPPSQLADCVSVVTRNKPTAPLNWDACPTLHLTGCPIIPTSTYHISAVIGGLLSGPPLVAATQAKPGVKWHGDCVGPFDGSKWTAPNGVVNADDFMAAIKTFQDRNAANATHVSVTDMVPNLDGEQINLIVGINDVFDIIRGFQGFEYPSSRVEECP